MRLPSHRGPLSLHVVETLRCSPHQAGLHDVAPADDEDLQLALFVLQQLSYRRYEGVDPAWEDQPSLLALRARLEASMEAEWRAACPVPGIRPHELVAELNRLVGAAEGPSLSRWMLEHGTVDHLREFVLHRAAYQLQEADPHTFAIPRLAAGVCKTAFLELQLDEYGGHEPTEAHASLFAETMTALGLEPIADIDRLPAATLATSTLLNRFGRSRRLLGACIGHLAVFEMTSVVPMSRYAASVRRLLGDDANAAARFYDVHVAADGFHEKLAQERLLRGFADQHPDEVGEVLWGAAALMAVERRMADHLIDSWEAGRTSLRSPIAGSELRPPRHLAAAS